MKGKLITPTCEVSGLPLPIFPREPPPGALLIPEGFGRITEDFHHHFHPRMDPELQTVAGQALRYSRGQDVNRRLHDNYHNQFIGPPLPHARKDKFKLAVLACAGVVPRQALVVESPRNYEIVEMDNDDYAKVASRSVIHIDQPSSAYSRYRKRKAIGIFFARYAVDQGIDNTVSKKVISEFLKNSTDNHRKRELGSFILRETLTEIVKPLQPLHFSLVKEGYAGQGAPTKLDNVVRKFFTKNYFPDYYDELARELRHVA